MIGWRIDTLVICSYFRGWPPHSVILCKEFTTLLQCKTLREETKLENVNGLVDLDHQPLQECQNGHSSKADVLTHFTTLLQKCGNARSLAEAKRIHAQIKMNGLEQNTCLANRLIWTYDKCVSPKDAWETFRTLVKKDIVAWNMMIGSYAHHGHGALALKVFHSMMEAAMRPDKVTFLNVLNACNKPFSLDDGRALHAYILNNAYMDSDIAVSTSLVNMYGKCGNVEDAYSVFKKMPKRNVISWTAMVSAYAQQGSSKAVIQIFSQMLQAGVLLNKITFVSILNSCTNSQALPDGKRFHSYIVERKPDLGKILGTALVSMYGRCGSLNDARYIFDNLHSKHDVVLWTAMITAYTDYEASNEALRLFQSMILHEVKANKITFASILEACSNVAAFIEGKLLHLHVIDEGIEKDLVVCNALINMYSKCGSIKDGHVVFKNMSKHDVISWNALISGYAQHGHGKEVIPLFQQMQQERVRPDKITFISVLSACSHAGLVHEACYYFTLMKAEYCIKPNVEHYRCVVDLLGRVGRVDEAEELIRDMPYVPGSMAWSSLLGACKVHANVSHGKGAAGHVLEFNSRDVAAVSMLSNVAV